jgi:hypothetical protein
LKSRERFPSKRPVDAPDVQPVDALATAWVGAMLDPNDDAASLPSQPLVEVLRRPFEFTLNAAIRVVHKTGRRCSFLNRSFQRRQADSRIEEVADGVPDHLPRPGVEDHGEEDKAGR